MTVGEFFGTLQNGVTYEWRKHLQSKSYNVHNILDDFYKDMPEKIDALIEAWQADNDIVNDYANVLDEDLDALQYMEALKKHTLEGRKLMTSPELESLCDDILSLIDSTIYKLKHLKESLFPLASFLNENMPDLNESVLGADFDIKDHDLVMNRVHEFNNLVKPAGGNRHGCVPHDDKDKYITLTDTWAAEIAKTYKKLSAAKAKAAFDNGDAVIVVKRSKDYGNIPAEYFFYVCAGAPVMAPGMTRGAHVAYIGKCPNFESTLYPKDVMSSRGCTSVTAFSIPNELAEEIITACYAEWPKRS